MPDHRNLSITGAGGMLVLAAGVFAMVIVRMLVRPVQDGCRTLPPEVAIVDGCIPAPQFFTLLLFLGVLTIGYGVIGAYLIHGSHDDEVYWAGLLLAILLLPIVPLGTLLGILTLVLLYTHRPYFKGEAD